MNQDWGQPVQVNRPSVGRVSRLVVSHLGRATEGVRTFSPRANNDWEPSHQNVTVLGEYRPLGVAVPTLRKMVAPNFSQTRS